MYQPFKRTLLRILKAPTEPPEAPAGSHASVQVFRASPGYLRYRLLGVLILAGFFSVLWLGIGVAVVVSEELLALLILVPIAALLLFIVVLQYVGARIDYDMRYYIVTDRSIRIREGAFVIQEKTLTHANVQNLNVVQGPLMRMFGIKSLAVDTAGGGGQTAQGQGAANHHRFELAGIENATEVRDLVLSYLRQRADGGLGDPDDVGEVSRGFGPEEASAMRDVQRAAASLRVALEARA